MSKQRIYIWLEEEEIEELEKIAEVLTEIKAKKEEKAKVPPSKRGREVSRSKAARACIIEGMKWLGVQLHNGKND